MSKFLSLFYFGDHFPLLGKELNEQSAKGKTYVIRFVYALLLFLFFTLFLHFFYHLRSIALARLAKSPYESL